VRAVDAVVRELGVDALVYGTDLPVIPGAEPKLGEAVRVALRERNPARLLATPPADAKPETHTKEEAALA
jgi:hypothetical protein